MALCAVAIGNVVSCGLVKHGVEFGSSEVRDVAEGVVQSVGDFFAEFGARCVVCVRFRAVESFKRVECLGSQDVVRDGRMVDVGFLERLGA